MCINVACRADVAVPQLVVQLQRRAHAADAVVAQLHTVVVEGKPRPVSGCDKRLGRRIAAHHLGAQLDARRQGCGVTVLLGKEQGFLGVLEEVQTLKRCNSASLRLLPHRRSRPLCHTFRAFRHKQDSTLVAEQTAISSIFAFFVSIYSVFVERPG